MRKSFYVCDSYHTQTIAECLKEAFPEAAICTDSSIASHGAGSPVLQAVIQMGKAMSEKGDIAAQQPDEKIDFFILSGKLILDGSVVPAELKKQHGNADAQIIAISTMANFLNEIDHLVDRAEDKRTFTEVDSVEGYFRKEYPEIFN